MKDIVTCTKCGWVSFAVSKAFAENEVKKFNTYFDSLPKREQIKYYGGDGASIDEYTCMRCGGNEFRPAKTDDYPVGCTLSPVIWEKVKG